MKRLLIKIAIWFVDRLIAFFDQFDKCEHSKPMCNECKAEWHKTRMSSGGW